MANFIVKVEKDNVMDIEQANKAVVDLQRAMEEIKEKDEKEGEK